jgi:hypothetical protein
VRQLCGGERHRRQLRQHHLKAAADRQVIIVCAQFVVGESADQHLVDPLLMQQSRDRVAVLGEL